MSEIEPGYYWARSKALDGSVMGDWETVQVEIVGREVRVWEFGVEDATTPEIWQLGPRLEPPGEK